MALENNINYKVPGSANKKPPLPSNSTFNQTMQKDIEDRGRIKQEELVNQLNKQKQKTKRYKKKLAKAQSVNVDYQQKIRTLLQEKEALLEKNKQLGWLIMKLKSEAGETFSEVSPSGKVKGSIMGLLQADITDYLL